MKIATTADRLKEIMDQRNLKQVDVLESARPFCIKYGIKLGRNDLSQYISGKVNPSQKKLTILGLALNVSEAWLMGFDVPMEKEKSIPVSEDALSDDEMLLIDLFRQIPFESRPLVLSMIKAALKNL
jgi:transcriptional regulator with XRE-family HTH domain